MIRTLRDPRVATAAIAGAGAVGAAVAMGLTSLAPNQPELGFIAGPLLFVVLVMGLAAVDGGVRTQ